MRADLASVSQMRRKLQEAAAREGDPRRKAIVAGLAGNAFVDQKALATLTEPGLNEARLRQVAEGVVERMNALTKAVRESGLP